MQISYYGRFKHFSRIDSIPISMQAEFFSPLMLRPNPDGTYQVVGQCLGTALGDSVSFLGPLPQPWRVEF